MDADGTSTRDATACLGPDGNKELKSPPKDVGKSPTAANELLASFDGSEDKDDLLAKIEEVVKEGSNQEAEATVSTTSDVGGTPDSDKDFLEKLDEIEGEGKTALTSTTAGVVETKEGAAGKQSLSAENGEKPAKEFPEVAKKDVETVEIKDSDEDLSDGVEEKQTTVNAKPQERPKEARPLPDTLHVEPEVIQVKDVSESGAKKGGIAEPQSEKSAEKPAAENACDSIIEIESPDSLSLEEVPTSVAEEEKNDAATSEAEIKSMSKKSGAKSEQKDEVKNSEVSSSEPLEEKNEKLAPAVSEVESMSVEEVDMINSGDVEMVEAPQLDSSLGKSDVGEAKPAEKSRIDALIDKLKGEKASSLAVEKNSAEAPIETINLDDDDNSDKSEVNAFEDKSKKSTSPVKESRLSDSHDDCQMKSGTADNSINLDKKPTAHIENKLISNVKHESSISSLHGSPAVSASNVFNSTPIQKQFEISSENVSKISGATEEASQIEKTMGDEEQMSTPGKIVEGNSTAKPEESSESTACTTSEQSSDSVKKYIEMIKRCNGTGETTDEDDSGSKSKVQTSNEEPSEEKLNTDAAATSIEAQTEQAAKLSNLYEVIVWFDQNDVKFLSVERMEQKKGELHAAGVVSANDSLGKSSSNGSVSSLAPFALPSSEAKALSGSSTSGGSSQKTVDGKLATVQKKTRHVLKGINELCTFMIDEFSKVKRLNFPDQEEDDEGEEDDKNATPKGRMHYKKKAIRDELTSPEADAGPSTPTSTQKSSRKGVKRTFNKNVSEDEDDSKPKPKQAKKSQPSKRSANSPLSPPAEPQAAAATATTDVSGIVGYCVLAKWVDRKYYAGRITDTKPGNKFVVLFEDGASKVLPKESIVFGQDDTLPLKDQSIHAMVDDDYETGIVQSIEKVDNKVVYTVKAETATVKVTASEIYLQDDQAKVIQSLNKDNEKKIMELTDSPSIGGGVLAASDAGSRSTRNKRPASTSSPATPEPGYSGGAAKKASRRQKRSRIPIMKRISESSDASDITEAAPPQSPEILEAIDGVQPELQRTQTESQISRIMLFDEYKRDYPTVYFDDLIGPLPKSNTLFKNKHFILSCTVKPKFYRTNDYSNSLNESEINRTTRFSTVPFVKLHLQKQLESGGAKVYNYFEEIPSSKYRFCKIISDRPCKTARYIQCLAANIEALSHEWVIHCCRTGSIVEKEIYSLPSGWSIISNQYIRFPIRKSPDHRENNKPFKKITILLGSLHPEFTQFWSRVCKLAGSTMRYIKSLSDITPTTTGFLLTDHDFPQAIRSKAEHFEIPIVSTVWIVQCLIMGRICDPKSNEKFREVFLDDDL